MRIIIQLDTEYACGGIIIKEGVCTEAAPIFRWMIGKTYEEIKSWKKIKRIRELELEE